MDKLSSFVEGLVSHLGRAYLLDGFVPALILVAFNQYFLFGPAFSGREKVWTLFPEVTEPVLWKFTGEILPTNKKVVYELDIKRLIERKLIMGIADGQVSVDGRVIYTAKGLKVGLFKPDETMTS